MQSEILAFSTVNSYCRLDSRRMCIQKLHWKMRTRVWHWSAVYECLS